jgi:rhodanese-related sulfurtransferase
MSGDAHPPEQVRDNHPTPDPASGDPAKPEDAGGRSLWLRWRPSNLASFLTFGVALFIGVFPVVLYALFFAGVPMVTALEARQELAAAGAQVALVDIRDQETFAQGHASGAINWSYRQILGLDSAATLPEELAGKELLLLSDTGLTGARAGRRLLDMSVPASYVHGGMQAWIATSAKESETILGQQDVALEEEPLAMRSLKQSEQLATVTAGLLIKPVYMGISLLLIIALWSVRAADIAALRWGLVFFLAGEVACVFNVTTYFTNGEQSDLFEYLHGLGMVLCLALISYAFLEGFDRRVIHVTQARRRCALLPMCRSCYKTHDVPCGMKRTFMLITLAIAALAFIPLSASLDATSYNGRLFGVVFNFSHPGVHQFYEIRYLPIVALGFLAVSLLLLLYNRKDPIVLARIPFSAGAGALGYSLLMLMLYAAFRSNLVWYLFWEEGTELLLIVAIGAFLWIFRRGLFSGESTVWAR